MQDSKERFNGRVSNYVKYRPSYPEAFIDYIKALGINWSSSAADIGAGTGKLTRRLLLLGANVYAVEPNDKMRGACLEYCAGFNNFEAVNAAAEDTALPDQCVDFITVAQAFHWFDKEKAKKEFRRILKPGGKVILVWNIRDGKKTPFMAAYEKFIIEYTESKKDDNRDFELSCFFRDGFEKKEFENQQQFDYEGLEGRALSSSYAPGPEDPQFNEFLYKLKQLYNQYNNCGKIDFHYNTVVYTGEV